MKFYHILSIALGIGTFFYLSAKQDYTVEVDVGLAVLTFAIALLLFRIVGLYIWFTDE